MTLRTADERIETERLLLRRVTQDDLPFFARIHANPDVARYLAHGRPRLLEETRAWMDTLLECYRTRALGQLGVIRKSDGELIGRCGLSYLETERAAAADGTRLGYYFPARAPEGANPVVESELGYTFDPASWGQGYASEAVRGIFDYAMKHRSSERIVSLIHRDNSRSQRVADRFSVTLVDTVTLWDRRFDRYAWPRIEPGQ